MKKMNFYFSRLTALATLLLAMVANQQLAAQCAPLNVTLTAACAAPTTGAAADIVEISKNNGQTWLPYPASITGADAGNTYLYRTAPGGTNCWSTILIEDKTAPVITCPAQLTLNCGTAIPASAANPFVAGNGITAGTVSDCSPWTVTFNDAVTNYPCTTLGTVGGFTDVLQHVVRTYTVKDKYNNATSCSRNIIIRRTAPGVATAANVVISCSVPQSNFATEAGAGAGWYRPVIGTDTVTATTPNDCGAFAVLKSVMRLPLCGGGVRFMRTWQVYDGCTRALINEVSQNIDWRDVTDPTGRISIDNYTLVPRDTFCFNMSGMYFMTQRCSTRVLDNAVRNLVDGGTINIIGLANPTTCLMSTVRFSLSNLDGTNCAGFTGAPRVRVSDNRLSLSNGVWSGTFMFANAAQVQSFTITVTDDCGNDIIQTVNVSYQDNAAPNALADDVRLQIPAGACSVRLNAAAVNENSTDNCGIKSIMIRKMTPVPAGGSANENNCWADYLDYTAADACLTGHMVIMRVVDFNDNCSEVMVPVRIDFKPTATCENLPRIEYNCTDNALLNYRALFTDPLTTARSSNPDCVTLSVVNDNIPALNIDCTERDITRTWNIRMKWCTSDSFTTAQCSQVLRVIPVRGFRLTTQGDSTYSCLAPTASGIVGSATWIENEKDKTIRSIGLFDCSGNKTCAAPVVEVEAWEFRSNQYCKIFRVRYTIVDQCVRPFPYYEAPIWGRDPGSTVCANLTARQSLIQDRGNAIVYERLIYIDDRTAPISTPPAMADICDGSTGDTNTSECFVNFTRTLTGSDSCGTNSASIPGLVSFMWSLQRTTTPDVANSWVQFHSGNTATVTAPTAGLPVDGTIFYRIVYRVTDLCGNMSAEYITDRFRTLDCKAPQIRVHNKILALAGQTGQVGTGMGNLSYIDIRNFIIDNCTGVIDDNTNLNFPSNSVVTMERGGATTATAPAAGSSQSIMYTCADLRRADGTHVRDSAHNVRVWARDGSGNWNYAITQVRVQDNDGICTPVAPQVQGAIANEAGTAVDNVNMTALVNGTPVSAVATGTNGSFALSVPTRGSNVQVTAAKTSEADAREGVSTADIAAISRHILGSQNLSSAYSVIAADVDKNGSVEAADMLQIRRFVLFISPALPAGSFRFVDKAYTFRNAAEPLGEDFPEVINVANMQANVAANFVAVKLGDVNNSYRHVSVRGSRSLMLTANDMDVIAGNEYTVNVNAANFDAAAFQGTFSFNGLTVKGIKAGSLSNMSDANFGQFNDAVTASWNGKSAGAADVVAITFVANKSGKLSDMMTFGSAKTAAEAIATNGEVLNVSLKFNSGKVSGSEFALYQNTPNPVATSTKVGFNLPKDGAARFTVFNAEGKVLFAKNGDYKAGYNEVILNKSELAAGVLYYRLETADHSATKKMIIIE